MKAPCVRCGTPLFVDTERGQRLAVTVTFDPAELADLAICATDPAVAERLCCALGLIDPDLERETRQTIHERRQPQTMRGA